ncbi:MAG: Arc family DNA-binding protein [Anaerolineales bacterium]|jgi:plasmid stability protein
MTSLTIKNIPPIIYERLKMQAENNRRSLNSEVITILERALSVQPIDVESTIERSRRLQELTASYTLTADEIEKMINEGHE